MTNTYDVNGVATQTQADSTVREFDYTLDGNGKVTQTDVTDPRGHIRRYTFNSSAYECVRVHGAGGGWERTALLPVALLQFDASRLRQRGSNRNPWGPQPVWLCRPESD
jgi:hypothetical protein